MDATRRTTELLRSSEILAGLLSQIARNNEGAMAELYDHTRHIVYGLVLRIVREQSAAEDTTQEVYMQIWRKAVAFDPERGSALSWIVTISRSRALDKLRSSRALLRHDNSSDELDFLHSPDPDPEHGSWVSERARLVRRSLSQLPPDQRRVIEMAFFDGLTQSEIASQTDLPLGTIKTRIRSGMRRLRIDESSCGCACPLSTSSDQNTSPGTRYRERGTGARSAFSLERLLRKLRSSHFDSSPSPLPSSGRRFAPKKTKTTSPRTSK
jgi:RNA polymerase sigma-70 factor (ECF subfamily)